MTKKTDVHMDLLKEILAELRRLNTNLEKHNLTQNVLPEATDSEDDDMDEFE